MSMFKYSHLHIVCLDIQAMIDFWTNVLGGRLIERRQFGTADGATLDLDGVRIYLRLPKTGEQPLDRGNGVIIGYDHVGLKTNDFVSAVRCLTDHGCRIVSGPTVNGNRRSIFVSGPENILLEVTAEEKRVANLNKEK